VAYRHSAASKADQFGPLSLEAHLRYPFAVAGDHIGKYFQITQACRKSRQANHLTRCTRRRTFPKVESQISFPNCLYALRVRCPIIRYARLRYLGQPC
jgi:hypothetical protein